MTSSKPAAPQRNKIFSRPSVIAETARTAADPIESAHHSNLPSNTLRPLSFCAHHGSQNYHISPHPCLYFCLLSLAEWRLCIWRREYPLVRTTFLGVMASDLISACRFAYMEGRAFRHGDIVRGHFFFWLLGANSDAANRKMCLRI